MHADRYNGLRWRERIRGAGSSGRKCGTVCLGPGMEVTKRRREAACTRSHRYPRPHPRSLLLALYPSHFSFFPFLSFFLADEERNDSFLRYLDSARSESICILAIRLLHLRDPEIRSSSRDMHSRLHLALNAFRAVPNYAYFHFLLS